jgi:hypothetical protein
MVLAFWPRAGFRRCPEPPKCSCGVVFVYGDFFPGDSFVGAAETKEAGFRMRILLEEGGKGLLIGFFARRFGRVGIGAGTGVRGSPEPDCAGAGKEGEEQGVFGGGWGGGLHFAEGTEASGHLVHGADIGGVRLVAFVSDEQADCANDEKNDAQCLCLLWHHVMSQSDRFDRGNEN